MNDYTIETIDYKGHTIETKQDDQAESPRERDCFGTMNVKRNGYEMGEMQLSHDDFREYINEQYDIIDYQKIDYELTDEQIEKVQKRAEKNLYMLDIYVYEHSGITMNTRGFSCGRDSGQAGYIFVDKNKVRKEYGVKRISKKLEKEVYKRLEGEVALYDDYITGSVYYYSIDGDHCDHSCCGFYGQEGYKDMIQKAKEEIDAGIEHYKKKHIQHRKAQIKANVPLQYREAITV